MWWVREWSRSLRLIGESSNSSTCRVANFPLLRSQLGITRMRGWEVVYRHWCSRWRICIGIVWLIWRARCRRRCWVTTEGLLLWRRKSLSSKNKDFRWRKENSFRIYMMLRLALRQKQSLPSRHHSYILNRVMVSRFCNQKPSKRGLLCWIRKFQLQGER